MSTNRNGEALGEYDLQIPLSPEDRDAKQELFFKNASHIAKQQEIVDAAKAVFKDETSMQMRQNGELMKELNQGFSKKKVRAVEWPNMDNYTMEYFGEDSPDGTPIAVVPMTSTQKRQYRLIYSKEKAESQD